jgi:deoxyribodipyrimidine photolyase-like uncharacterized protein
VGARRGGHLHRQDGRRLFPATRPDALAELDHFVTERLASIGSMGTRCRGRPVDGALDGVGILNLGVLDPLGLVRRAEAAYLGR